MQRYTWILTILFVFINIQSLSGAHSDRVLLTDVKALTLHDGKMTNYRRSSPVPQLTCVGGSAAGAFKPKTVQCLNRGSDGSDVQWECKTDMDNSYRFGRIEVSCEGYDYPEDPYVLRGSCGLEYTLEFTEEGWARQKAQGQGKFSPGSQYTHDRNTNKGSFVRGLVFFFIIAVITYTIYKKCIGTPNRPPNVPRDNPPSYDEAVRSRNHHDNRQQPSAPPPPGFRPEFIPNTEDSCSSGPPPAFDTWSSTPNPSTMTGNTHQAAPPPVTKTESTKATKSSAPQSSGTRTASGFGGTSRREYTPEATTTETAPESSSSTTVPPSTGTSTVSGFGGTTRR